MVDGSQHSLIFQKINGQSYFFSTLSPNLQSKNTSVHSLSSAYVNGGLQTSLLPASNGNGLVWPLYHPCLPSLLKLLWRKNTSTPREVLGVGNFIAGAIVLIAFKDAMVVVDGNVVRCEAITLKAAGKKKESTSLQFYIHKTKSGDKGTKFYRWRIEVGKPVSSICHGQQILATARVLKERKCPAYPRETQRNLVGWMLEVYAEDTRKMESLMNVDKGNLEKLVCNVCKAKYGACVRYTGWRFGKNLVVIILSYGPFQDSTVRRFFFALLVATFHVTHQ
ncbi:hypothetical protein AAG906_001789 [Vitis piasezkii]